MGKTTVSFRMDEKLKKEFTVRAAIEGMNFTEALNEAINDFLDKYLDRQIVAELAKKKSKKK